MFTYLASTQETVHTAGVNWLSVFTIVGISTTIMSILFGVLARYISNKVSGAIDRFRIDVIAKMDERITILETKDSNRVEREAVSKERHPRW